MSNYPFTRNQRLPTKKQVLTDAVKILIVIGAVVWFYDRTAGTLGYHWQWYRIPQLIVFLDADGIRWGPLVYGLEVTLKISGASLLLAMGFGLVTALFRLSDSLVARTLARGYMELVRNTPLLVQLFFMYFVLGPILDIDRLTSAVLALSLFEGAYISEIFRAGIVSIHKGQWDAAHALGLSGVQTYRHVILPQAVRRVIPPLTGQSVSLIKDSALVSTIAVYDLTMRAQEIIAETYLAFEVWFTIAAMYLVLTVTLSFTAACLESRMRVER